MTKVSIENYQTIIFDCDGVVLDSNKVKTHAFYKATEHFGHDSAQELLQYHIKNGGISRYVKFDYFITDILKQPSDKNLLDNLLERFSIEVKKGLLNSTIAKDLRLLREHTKDSKWVIVSGGDQNELRDIFDQRGIKDYFDGGIFGSPDTKNLIFSREQKNHNISRSSIYLGDSTYDFKAAQQANIDFIFVSDWTEVKDWEEFIRKNHLNAIPSLNTLLNL